MDKVEAREWKVWQTVLALEKYRRNSYTKGLSEAYESFQEYVKIGGKKTFKELHEVAVTNVINEQIEIVEELKADLAFAEVLNFTNVIIDLELIEVKIKNKIKFIDILRNTSI